MDHLTKPEIGNTPRRSRSPELRSKRQSIIIELTGPPGAGKTTTCDFLTARLQETDFSVLTLQDIKDHIRTLSYYRKVLLFIRTLATRGRNLLFFTATLASNRLLSASSLYRYARISVFDTALKELVKTRSVDLVLLEQWIIQELWSATIFKPTSYHGLAAKFKPYHFRSDYVFYLEIDMATASERIQHRGTNLSRFDSMAAEKRIRELNKHNEYLFQLYQSSTCQNKHIVSTQHTPAVTAENLLQHLELA